MVSSTVRFLFCFALLSANAVGEVAGTEKNPIRKVVGMLQNMQKGVEAEGKREQELFDKFMCYCNNGAGSLQTAIATSQSSVESLTGKIDSETALKSQLAQDIKQHQVDRDEAKKTVQEASTMREKEEAEFAQSTGEMKGNLQAMDGALAALKKGLGYAMLQTGTASFLRNLVQHSPAVRPFERETLLSFLDAGATSQEAGSSDQIIGIVETMKETMQGDLDETASTEERAKASFKSLSESKTSEVSAAGKAVEQKTVRSGEVAVSVTQAKADLEDTQEALGEDEKFAASLKRNCATKQQEWDARSKSRTEEIAAISETIEILNDDDALDLFKKTMPSAGGALLQISVNTQAKGQALNVLRNLLLRVDDGKHAAQLKLIMLALKSRNNGGFDKVVSLIDGMVAVLAKEQSGADAKKDNCHEELHKSEVEEKALATVVNNVVTDIAQNEDELAQMKAEIEGLQQGIAALDKMVVEATQQRKEEHEEYTDLAASNSAALQLLEMAKNRMNKFYNPSLYKAAPTTTVADSPYGLLQVSLQTRFFAAGLETQPAAPPSGEYKKSAGSTGIISMMDQMIRDVENDTTAAKHGEADSQKDYTESMSEAATKRADDSKLIVEKESAKASLGESLASQREIRYTKRQQLGLAGDTLSDFHRSCDGFLENFDEAKANRAKEIDGLKESKSVLKGAAAL